MKKFVATLTLIALATLPGASAVAAGSPAPHKRLAPTKQTLKAPQRKIGAVCKDGTTTKVTGRGACSKHGGVSRWLY